MVTTPLQPPVTLVVPHSQGAAFGLPAALTPIFENYFMEAYAQSENANRARNAAEFWIAQAESLTLARFGNDEAALNIARRDMLETAAAYEEEITREYEEARRKFWTEMTAPPDPAAQARIAELDRQIEAKLREIERNEVGGRIGSIVTNLATLGMGGWIADAVAAGVSKQLLDDLAKLSLERAALDKSGDRGMVAMVMTDAVIELLGRGGPYDAAEQALIDTVGKMVQNSAVEVAQNASDMFREWKAGQEQLRANRGVSMAAMYDIGSPAPDFTMRAMARAGLGPGGDGFNGALVASLAGTAAAAGGRVVDKTSLGGKLAARLFPFSRRPVAGEFVDFADDAARAAQSKWRVAEPSGRNTAAIRQWMRANPSSRVGNVRAGWQPGYKPSAYWSASNVPKGRPPTGGAGIIDDIARAGVGLADDAARAAGSSAARVANSVRNAAAKIGYGVKAVKTMFSAAGKAAGPIGTAVAVVVDVGMGAGEIAVAYDTGQEKLDAATRQARETPVTTTTLAEMTSTEDGRLQLISIITGQIKRNPLGQPQSLGPILPVSVTGVAR